MTVPYSNIALSNIRDEFKDRYGNQDAMDYALSDYYAEVTYVPKGEVGYPAAPLGNSSKAVAIPKATSANLKNDATGGELSPPAKISIGNFAGAVYHGIGNYRFTVSATNINEGQSINCTLTADYVWGSDAYHYYRTYRAPSFGSPDVNTDYANRSTDLGNWSAGFYMPYSTMAAPLDSSYTWSLGPWYYDQSRGEGQVAYVIRVFNQYGTQVGSATVTVNDTSTGGELAIIPGNGFRNRTAGTSGGTTAWSWTVPSGVYRAYFTLQGGGGGSWSEHGGGYSWQAMAGAPAIVRYSIQLNVSPGQVFYGDIGGGGGTGYYIAMNYGGNGGWGGNTTLYGPAGRIILMPGGPYRYQSGNKVYSTQYTDNPVVFGDTTYVYSWGGGSGASGATNFVGNSYDWLDGTGPYGSPPVPGSVNDPWSYIDGGWGDTYGASDTAAYRGYSSYPAPFSINTPGVDGTGLTQQTLNRLGYSNYPGYVYIYW